MATIKSYTDISQSHKLAEILPLESADMYWQSNLNSSDRQYLLDIGEEEHFNIEINFEHCGIGEYDIPAWSLAALLGVLEHPRCFQGDKPIYWFCGCFGKDNLYHEVEADNPVDVCYKMIIELHKLNLL